MLKKFTATVALVVGLAQLFSNASHASIWSVSFDGSISGITEYFGEISTSTKGNYNFHNNRFFAGQNFSGTLLIDDAAPAESTLSGDPEKDIYSSVVSSFLNIGGYEYRKGVTSPSYTQIWNRGPQGTIPDIFSSGGNTYIRPFDVGPGNDLSSFKVQLFDYDGDVFQSTSLIDTLTTLSLLSNIVEEFEYANLNMLHVSQSNTEDNHYLFVEGEFSNISVSQLSPVPLPPAALLFGGALLGLVAVARRR